MIFSGRRLPFVLNKVLKVWIHVIAFTPVLSGYGWTDMSGKAVDQLENNLSPVPFFDGTSINRHVQARIGQTVLLPCVVRDLGDKVVSWIRSRDLHILTSSIYVFSGDSRFVPVHPDMGNFWGLRIRGVSVNDTGQYECQVNTDPKISFAVSLTVSDNGVPEIESPRSEWISRALIEGPREVYVRYGSRAMLTCEVSPLQQQQQPIKAALGRRAHPNGALYAASPDAPVRWLHDDVELQPSWELGISILTKSESDMKTVSVMDISRTTTKHSGRYTCLQPSSIPDTVMLIVTEEYSEAMQRDYPVQPSSGFQLARIYLLELIYLSIILYII